MAVRFMNMYVLVNKGDRISIGSSNPNFMIEEQVLEYKDGDMVYLCSDGIIDQFGGEDIKRFKSKKLKHLLLSIHSETMQSQKEIIDNSFHTWRGVQDQTDDVAIIGIKL